MCLACGAGRVDHDASFLCESCRGGAPSPHIVLWTIAGPDIDGRYLLREWVKDDPRDDIARVEHRTSWASFAEAHGQLPPAARLAGVLQGEEFWIDPSDDLAVPKREND